MPKEFTPQNYMTNNTDITYFGGMIPSMYPMFAGTPEADLMYNINHSVYSMKQQLVGSEVEDERRLIFKKEEIPEGFVEIDAIPEGFVEIDTIADNRSGEEHITDEIFTDGGYDRILNDHISQLNEAIDSGRYQEGSIQHVMLSYTRYALDKLRNREFIFSPQKNDYGDILIASDVMSKFANNGFIPILSDEEKAGLRDDHGTSFFTPNEDQQRAAYTRAQLQEAADKTNLGGLYYSGLEYMNAAMDVANMIGIASPDTPEKEQIIRNRLLGEITNHRNEILKTVSNDPNDPVVQGMYDGKLGQAADTIGESHRSYNSNLRELGYLEDYLKSGLPVDRYNAYVKLAFAHERIMSGIKGYQRYFSNSDAYVNAVYELDDKLSKLPGQGATKAECEAYLEEVNKLVRNASQEYDRFKAGLKDRPAPEDMSEEEKKVFQKRQKSFRERTLDDTNNFTDDFRIYSRYAGDMTAPVSNIHTRMHKLYVNAMENMEKSSNDIADSLKEYRRLHGRDYDEEINKALDDTIKKCEDELATPSEINKALTELEEKVSVKQGLLMDGDERQRGAALNHMEPLRLGLADMVSHYSNLVRGAESRGILTGEPVSSQLMAEKTPDGPQYDDILQNFNTRRWVGGETTEHRLCRESFERLKKLDNELKAIDKKAHPNEWMEKAGQVIKEAGISAGLAKEYLEDKEYKAKTPAGKSRLQGAKDILAAANMVKAGINRQIETDKRYERMQQNTRHVEPIDTKPLEERLKGTMADNRTRKEFMEYIHNGKEPVGERIESFMAEYCASEKGDDNIKSVAKGMLKDAALPAKEGEIALKPEEMKKFFKELGKHSVDSTMDAIKAIENDAAEITGEKQNKSLLFDAVMDQAKDILDDPRIKRYNNGLTYKDVKTGEWKVREGKELITADMVGKWYEEGQKERISTLSKDELDKYENRDRIYEDAFKKEGITEDNVLETMGKSLNAYMAEKASEFKDVYEDTVKVNRAKVDEEFAQKAADKDALAKDKAEVKERIEKQMEAAKAPKEIDIKQLKEKTGVGKHENVHADRKSLNGKQAQENKKADVNQNDNGNIRIGPK